MDAAEIVYMALVFAAAGMIVCRAGQMTPQTLAVVRWQHMLLLAGLLFGLALKLVELPAAGDVCTSAGVMLWLLLAAPRWRRGPPEGTMRPQPAPQALDCR